MKPNFGKDKSKIIRLSVPFHQKDKAKELGAKWNAKDRYWFVSNEKDLSLFSAWLQNENSKINIRADSYFIAESSRNCWKCEMESKVYAIILNEPNKRKSQYSKILNYIRYLDTTVINKIEVLSKGYYYDASGSGGDPYWMNHCYHCGAKLGDFETIEEMTSPFRPWTSAEASRVILYFINSPIQAFGGYDRLVPFLDYMTRKPFPGARIFWTSLKMFILKVKGWLKVEG